MPRLAVFAVEVEYDDCCMVTDKVNHKQFGEVVLPQPFFPVMMLSVPSMSEASMVRSEESLVPPKIMGSLPSILASFIQHGNGELFNG